MNLQVTVTLTDDERRVIETGLRGSIDRAVNRVIAPNARATWTEIDEAIASVDTTLDELRLGIDPAYWIAAGAEPSVADDCVTITRRHHERALEAHRLLVEAARQVRLLTRAAQAAGDYEEAGR